MTLFEQVKQSLKWKRSNQDAAAKLGISVDKYKQIKQQIFNFQQAEDIGKVISVNKVTEFKEDLEKGTAEIKGFAVLEPRTAEDIIELLKIDTTKWKLSSYWNKERHDGWFISAMVTALKQEPKDMLADVIANFKPEYQPVGEVFINRNYIHTRSSFWQRR
jgi:hypothetical protein